MSDERNYAAEAVRILTGQTSMLPEMAHLQALAAQQESVLREHRLLTELLTAIMVDNGQPQIFIPAADLERVRKHAINIVITQNPRNAPGAVLVDIARRPAAIPADLVGRRN